MAVTQEYPVKGEPIVRGDPLAIIVDIADSDGPIDVSEFQWRAHIRRSPDSALLMEFDIQVITPDDGDVPCRVVLNLTAEQTRLLRTGYGFDLEQMAPVERTWWICPKIYVEKDYSHD